MRPAVNVYKYINSIGNTHHKQYPSHYGYGNEKDSDALKPREVHFVLIVF